MSRRGSAHSWGKSGPNTMDKAVNTTADLLLCSKCRDRIHGGHQKIMLKEYIKSIEYINSCHSLLNQLVSKQKCENAFALPDIPNFVNVFSIVYNQFQKKKQKPLHELDNIESLDEIYSRIESMDVSDRAKRSGNNTDSEVEAKKKPASRGRVRQNDTSDDENGSVVSNKKVVRNSSIPRPVSSEKVRCQNEERNRPALTHSLGRLQRQDYRGKYVNPQKVVRHENEAVLLERNERVSELSERDLEKYAKDLLRSRSESPSTPRSISSNSRSPSPRYRRLNMRVPSRMKLTVSPKMPRLHSKLTPTISEIANKLENMPERNECPVTDSKLQLPLSNHSADTKKWQTEENHALVAQQPVREENVEGKDNSHHTVASPTNSIKLKHGDYSKTSLDPQYVVKQKPNDFFTNRRRLSDIISKPLFPDTDAETDKEAKAYNSESDIDDDVFEKKSIISTKSSKAGKEAATFPPTPSPPETCNIIYDDVFEKESVKSTKNSKTGEVNNTYNLLKMSISRPLSNSVLSNIGILTHSGKMKPEKEEELVRLKKNLSKDKQNTSFRQPRHRSRESQLLHAKTKKGSLLGNMSSPSSEIKSDEEAEVNSHPLDSHGHYYHRRNHY